MAEINYTTVELPTDLMAAKALALALLKEAKNEDLFLTTKSRLTAAVSRAPEYPVKDQLKEYHDCIKDLRDCLDIARKYKKASPYKEELGMEDVPKYPETASEALEEFEFLTVDSRSMPLEVDPTQQYVEVVTEMTEDSPYTAIVGRRSRSEHDDEVEPMVLTFQEDPSTGAHMQ